MSDVRTYINSGKLVFSAGPSSISRLTARIEKALQRVVEAIAPVWTDDKVMRTYVLLLWSELDDSSIIGRLPGRPGVDELRYAPGAVIWRVDPENVSRSHRNRIVGTPLYKKVTMRSANTVRKLNELTATYTRS